MQEIISWFAKGIGIGTANVIPGVSGGTIALITGIFERLIKALKSFNLKSLKLLLKLKLKEFAASTDLKFLLFIVSGVAVSIFTFAYLLEFLFIEYPVFVWAYFFGLILASVFFVGKTVDKFSLPVIISFTIGTAFVVWISFLNPATENASFRFLIICGILAVISMILPVIIGAAIGLSTFSGFLSWIYKKFKNQTIATLTGFIFGSLLILWLRKKEIYLLNDTGLEILNKDGERIVSGYERYVPNSLNSEVLFATAFFIIEILSIWTIEHFAKTKTKSV